MVQMQNCHLYKLLNIHTALNLQYCHKEREENDTYTSRRGKKKMGMQEEAWRSSGGVYLEGLPELISQSADLREDVTNEKGL